MPERRPIQEHDPGQASVTVRRTRTSRSRPVALVAGAVLVGLALTAGVGALVLDESVVLDESGDASGDTQAPVGGAAAEPTTALLSARRVPEWTTRPTAGRALAAAVQPIADAAPPQSCIGVGDGTFAWYAHNTEAPLVPASNIKLLTGAAALDILGAETSLTTTIAADAAPAGGVVEGNLYLIGGGDPLLTTETYQNTQRRGRLPETDFEAVADQVVAAGINRISGSVVGDESRYDGQHSVPGWPERWFSGGTVAPLSALLVNDAWLVDPLTGTGPGGAATDPAAHAATVLSQLLGARGVAIDGPPTSGTAPAGASVVTEVSSLPVGQIVDEVLAFSDNTSAELLVKEIGLQVSDDPSTTAGTAAVAEWAAAEGLSVDALAVSDGSGLSDTNQVSCNLLAEILRSDGPQGPVATGLAVPGQPGTLVDRFGGDELAQRLRAKTGTLNEVTSLSGWLASRPGTMFDFEFVINTPDGSVGGDELALQSQLVNVLLDQPISPPIDEAGPTPATAQ